MKKRVIGLCVVNPEGKFLYVDIASGGYVFWSDSPQIFPVNYEFSNYQLGEIRKEQARIKEIFIEI